MFRLKRYLSRKHYKIGRARLLFSGIFISWYLWVIGVGIGSQSELALTSPYLLSPAALVVGLVVGGFFRRLRGHNYVIHLLVMLLVVTLLSTRVYANASAAVGGLIIALVGLLALEIRETLQFQQSLAGTSLGIPSETQVLRRALVLALLLCGGVLLVLNSQAAVVLSAPVAIVIVFTVWSSTGPARWLTVSLGLVTAVCATLLVIILGGRNYWPDWMASEISLGSARHTLWSDALHLWAMKPLIGSGPGSFTPSSELASNTPSLAAVHSLPLQVGSELGIVGLTLLACLFLAGLLFAARGSRPVAFIAIAAWTALAVHSSIDHLEDFPIVAFMGGVVLGWSGFDPQSSEASRRTENTIE